MALVIDNPEVERLAKELAARRGTPVDVAVLAALRALAPVDATAPQTADDLIARMSEIADHLATLPVLDSRSADEILGYDARGVWPTR